MTSLNIKNEEVVRLVKQLADREGISMTTAVHDAVREKLEQGKKPAINEERKQYFLDMGRRVRASTDPKWLATNPFDDLYDDDLGLPK